MHEKVIAELEAGGPQLEVLKRLAAAAGEARDALKAGDLDAYGAAMVRNNECQRALYSGLVSSEADAAAAVARRHGAPGWKVNGAGGRGGSMTVLAPGDDGARRRMVEELEGLGRGIRVLPTALAPQGVQAWEPPAKDSRQALSNSSLPDLGGPS
jgi:D-glycero-alpha-D-manno-heptose-7-phosphate kinase